MALSMSDLAAAAVDAVTVRTNEVNEPVFRPALQRFLESRVPRVRQRASCHLNQTPGFDPLLRDREIVQQFRVAFRVSDDATQTFRFDRFQKRQYIDEPTVRHFHEKPLPMIADGKQLPFKPVVERFR